MRDSTRFFRVVVNSKNLTFMTRLVVRQAKRGTWVAPHCYDLYLERCDERKITSDILVSYIWDHSTSYFSSVIYYKMRKKTLNDQELVKIMKKIGQRGKIMLKKD